MRKKILALLLSVSMLASLLVIPAAAVEYTDANSIPEWAQSSVERWTAAGVMGAEADGSFAPAHELTRAEFAILLCKLMGYTEKADPSLFTDLPEDTEAADALLKLAAAGVMLGIGNNQAAPNGTLTREQTACMMFRALNMKADGGSLSHFADADQVSDWAVAEISAMTSKKLLEGDGANLYPGNNIPKQDMAALLDKMIAAYVTEDGAAIHTGSALNPSGAVIIKAKNVTIESAAESGSILVAPGAPKNTVVTVAGPARDITIAAGGAEVAVAKDAQVDSVTAAAENAKVIVNKGGKAGSVVAGAPKAVVEVSGSVSSVVVAEGADDTAVTAKDGSDVGRVATSAEGVTINGAKDTIGTVIAGQGSAEVKAKGAEVFNSGAAVKVDGKPLEVDKTVVSNQTGSAGGSSGSSSGSGGGSNTPAVESTSSTVILRNGIAPDLLTVGTSSVTVKTGTTVSALLSQIKAKDGGAQQYRVTDSSRAEKTGDAVIAEGDKLVVTSSNGKAEFTNELHVKEALSDSKEYWDDKTYSHIDETVNANTPVFRDVDYVVTSEAYAGLVHEMVEEYYVLENGTSVPKTQTVDDYTKAIQTAIDDATAAGGGRVVIPAKEGAAKENPTVYYTGSIEIKSNVNLHIEENVELRFVRNISNEYYPMVLSSFEGNDTYNYAAPIRAFHAENIGLTGKGTINPQADNVNWWAWKKGTYGQPNQATVVDVLVKQWSDRAYPVQYRLLNDGETPLPKQIPTMDIDWNDITKVTMIDTPATDDSGEAITPLKSLLRPCSVETYACQNILIEDIRIINSPMWEVHPLRSRNVLVRGLDINSHGANNDGVDPESTCYVVIENCSFDTGDDCIAIKSGKNRDGYSRGQVGGEPSENLIVRNSVFADGHGGVTAGSECTGGVRNVFATDNHYDSENLQQVLRFKTNSYRGGLIENIYFKDSTVAKASNALMYGETQYTAGSAQDKEGDLGPYTPQLKNVYMSNITAGSPDSAVNAKNAIYYTAYERAPMTDIKVKDVTVYGTKNQFNLVNVKNFELDNVKISLASSVADLTAYNTVPIAMESVKLTVEGKDYPLTEGAGVQLPDGVDKTKMGTVSGVISTADAKFAASQGTVNVYLDRGVPRANNKKPVITPYPATVTKLEDGKYSFTVEIPLYDKPNYEYAYRPETEAKNMLPGNHIISIVATGEKYNQNTWNYNAVCKDGAYTSSTDFEVGSRLASLVKLENGSIMISSGADLTVADVLRGLHASDGTQKAYAMMRDSKYLGENAKILAGDTLVVKSSDGTKTIEIPVSEETKPENPAEQSENSESDSTDEQPIEDAGQEILS